MTIDLPQNLQAAAYTEFRSRIIASSSYLLMDGLCILCVRVLAENDDARIAMSLTSI